MHKLAHATHHHTHIILLLHTTIKTIYLNPTNFNNLTILPNASGVSISSSIFSGEDERLESVGDDELDVWSESSGLFDSVLAILDGGGLATDGGGLATDIFRGGNPERLRAAPAAAAATILKHQIYIFVIKNKEKSLEKYRTMKLEHVILKH